MMKGLMSSCLRRGVMVAPQGIPSHLPSCQSAYHLGTYEENSCRHSVPPIRRKAPFSTPHRCLSSVSSVAPSSSSDFLRTGKHPTCSRHSSFLYSSDVPLLTLKRYPLSEPRTGRNLTCSRHSTFLQSSDVPLVTPKRYSSNKPLSVYEQVLSSDLVHSLQSVFSLCHDLTGFQWAGTIVTTTLTLRLVLTFPLSVYAHNIRARVERAQPEIIGRARYVFSQRYGRRVKLEKWPEKRAEKMFLRLVRQQAKEVYVKENCHPSKGSILLLTQLPLWIMMSLSLRNMSGAFSERFYTDPAFVIPELASEGALWFPDLTLPDPYLVLPVTVGLLNLANIEMNALRKGRVSPFQRRLNYFLREYIKIVKIPAGVTNLKIEEVKESPYFIALKETTNGRYILNGNKKQSKAHDFIDSGVRFIYQPDGTETVVTAGPLPYAIQLRVYVTKEISLVQVRWSYFEKEQQVRAASPHPAGVVGDEGEPLLTRPVTEEVDEVPEYPDTPAGFTWEAKGWTNCTEKCEGGISYYQYHCLRASDGAVVHQRRCGQAQYDPEAISKPCNEQECLPEKPPPVYEWQASDWGQCSRTCGRAGTKSRTTTCHEFRYNDDGTLFERATEVTDGFCHSDDRPADVTECQGRPCSAEWTVGDWSTCSVTCGSGKQSRNVDCNKPPGRESEFKCYVKPATQKTCILDPCPVSEECVPSPTSVCKPKNYQQFCGVFGYEDFCCTTCEEQKKKLAKSKRKKKGRRGSRAQANGVAEFVMFASTTTTQSPSE